MKKLIALVLAVMMVLSCSIVAAAEGTATLKFVSDPVVEENQEVTVELVAENIDAVSALQVSIEYDETKLELVSVTPADVLSGAVVNSVVSEECTVEPGEIHIAWDANKAVSISGVVVTLKFKAISSTLGGAYVGFMEGEEILFYDSDYEEVSTDVDEESEKVEIDYVHEHTYNTWKVVAEASCTEPGEERLYCDAYEGTCDEYSDVKPIEASGHKDTNFDHVCENNCGEYVGEHKDSATDADHVCDYGCGAVLEDCADKTGDNDHNCDVCGAKDITTHSYGDATCEEPATCEECGESTGSALGHKDDDYNHVCDNGCGKDDMGEHADSATDADHVCDYGCGAVLEDCADKAGDNDHKCDVCGKADVTDHSYGEATCEAPATCSECGNTTGSALGHLDENSDHICDRQCGKADMGEHKDSATDADHVCDYGCGAVLENCSDKNGDNNHNCDVCGKENVTNHVYGNADCDAPATCVECGETTGSALGHADENNDHVCDRNCGKTDMGEHKDSATDADHVCDYGCGAVLEDCADKAGDNDHKCDVCGKDGVTDHKYDSVVTGPTCTEGGYTTHTCSECGNGYESDKTEALGHSGEWTAVEGKEPTCTVDGEESRTCTVCGEVETRDVKATGHKFGKWEIIKSATEYNEGLKQRTCSVCGEEETIVIPKIESNVPNPGVTVIEPGKQNGETNPNTGAITAMGLAVLAAVGGAAAFISKKKK